MTELQSSSVVVDQTRGVLGISRCKQTNQGTAKQIVKDVCPRFDIISVCALSVYGQAKHSALVVQYRAQGNFYCDFVPDSDAGAIKYHKYLSGIQKFPAASNRDLDEVIDSTIRTCPTRIELTLYERQGFFESPDGTLTFARPLNIQGLPPKLVSESLQKRRHYVLDPYRDTSEQVIAQYCQLCSQSLTMKIAGLYMVSSLFLPFFPREMTQDLALLNFVVQDRSSEEKLAALFCTNDLSRYTVPELGMGAKKLAAELNQVYDGVAVVVDHCFADEEATVREGTKEIIKARSTGRKLIASISDKIGFGANQLEEGCCITIPVEGTLCCEDVQTIRMISSKMESLMIDYILRNQSMIKAHINDRLQFCICREEKTLPIPVENMINLLGIVDYVNIVLLHLKLMSKSELSELLEKLSHSTDLNRTLDDLILDDFVHIMSKKIRDGVFPGIRKKNLMVVDQTKNPIILYGERLYISQELLTLILSDLQTTHKQRSFVNALKRSGVLNATDGNTHPLDAFDIAGNRLRLYCYDISTHILDADVQETLMNPDAARLFIRPERLPDKDFLPLVSRTDGSIAGRQIRYAAATNNSIAIWGQSGYGKTYLLMQLIKRTAELGHRVVVFDSSDSFTMEALCATLPKDFVDAHMMVYDLDQSEIPVDLFRIDRSKSRDAQEEMLLDSISIGITDPTTSQMELLSAGVHDALEILNPGEPVSLEDICTMLDEKSPSYRSLMSHLKPLLRTIKQRGMANRTWKEFLTKKVSILRIDTSIAKRGNTLFDLLIASLYAEQCKDPTEALDIFVDEIQCQKLSKGSPIHKLLTEGRKKHISFYGATQDYYLRNTDIGSTMGKADTQIFLKPTLNSTELVAKELRFNKADCEKLDRMVRGFCYVKGNLYDPEIDRNTPTIISGTVTSL